MQTVNLSDKQGMEICENVSRMLVSELDKEEVWKRVEKMLADYITKNNLSLDASYLADSLEWSVKVRLKK